MSQTDNFDYAKAFCRNRGWISEIEFAKIKNYKIAIAGVGGVGGSHLVALVRMGFNHFVISDPDIFEIQNFNRQYGADTSTLGLNKCCVMRDIALRINPQARIEILEGGLTENNLDIFLDRVDLYVDGLDLFELNIRQQIFRLARIKNIPAVTSAPIGFGASSMTFTKHSMSFDRYFDFKDEEPLNNLLKFVLGLAPSLMHVRYLAERESSNLFQRKTSSTAAGCFAASAIVTTEAVKILLKRGTTLQAPQVRHFDFFLNQYKESYVPFGMRNPYMQVKLFILKKMLKRINEKI